MVISVPRYIKDPLPTAAYIQDYLKRKFPKKVDKLSFVVKREWFDEFAKCRRVVVEVIGLEHT